MSVLTLKDDRYAPAYHHDGRWRVVDRLLRDFSGLPYRDGVHRHLMFSTYNQAHAWLQECKLRGLDMEMPPGAPQWDHTDYERWRARVG